MRLYRTSAPWPPDVKVSLLQQTSFPVNVLRFLQYFIEETPVFLGGQMSAAYFRVTSCRPPSGCVRRGRSGACGDIEF